jgi:hypothetical protein
MFTYFIAGCKIAMSNIIGVPKLFFEISNGIDVGIIYLCTNVYISHIVS